MTSIEQYCADALCLSSASAEALHSQIKMNIENACADLVRMGIPSNVANDCENSLVRNCIIKYVKGEMDSSYEERIRSASTYRLVADELRKSIDA
ncbi:MAG: hypothetical protein KBT03_12770 [Bacteroidales bacterium]|nr:hypothetical protein [Candidatus Scybalousia scybalohippi]